MVDTEGLGTNLEDLFSISVSCPAPYLFSLIWVVIERPQLEDRTANRRGDVLLDYSHHGHGKNPERERTPSLS